MFYMNISYLASVQCMIQVSVSSMKINYLSSFNHRHVTIVHLNVRNCRHLASVVCKHSLAFSETTRSIGDWEEYSLDGPLNILDSFYFFGFPMKFTAGFYKQI